MERKTVYNSVRWFFASAEKLSIAVHCSITATMIDTVDISQSHVKLFLQLDVEGQKVREHGQPHFFVVLIVLIPSVEDRNQSQAVLLVQCLFQPVYGLGDGVGHVLAHPGQQGSRCDQWVTHQPGVPHEWRHFVPLEGQLGHSLHKGLTSGAEATNVIFFHVKSLLRENVKKITRRSFFYRHKIKFRKGCTAWEKSYYNGTK